VDSGGRGLAPSRVMTTAAPTSPATPIFDEVDRWWRAGGDEPTTATMLSFTRARPLRTVAASASASGGPRHGSLRPLDPPA
jgi:hypothetical protein